MPVPGTKPVADRSQVRFRGKPSEGTDWRDVENVPFAAAPPLPSRDETSSTSKGRPLSVMAASWPAATQRWWTAISTMPHCALWTPSDWQYAIDTAESHARFAEGWRGCASGAELRMREKRMGITHDDRRDLRIRYVPPKDTPDPNAPSAGVVQLDDYRGL